MGGQRKYTFSNWASLSRLVMVPNLHRPASALDSTGRSSRVQNDNVILYKINRLTVTNFMIITSFKKFTRLA